jgi:hypothetical protein
MSPRTMGESKPERRNRRQQAEVLEFARQYARKRPRGGEPNDRQYRRKTEAWVRRLDPEVLDDLLNGDL